MKDAFDINLINRYQLYKRYETDKFIKFLLTTDLKDKVELIKYTPTVALLKKLITIIGENSYFKEILDDQFYVFYNDYLSFLETYEAQIRSVRKNIKGYKKGFEE